MSTQAREARNEIDDEPEEGEIQDDEGSLEDVSSDEEILPAATRKERYVYASTFVPMRGQLARSDRHQINQVPRKDFRFSSRDHTDLNVSKSILRRKSGCRTSESPDTYYEIIRHKVSKDHNQKVSVKIYEKENKVKESKKAYRRSMPFQKNLNDLKHSYIVSEHPELYFPSTSSKGPWYKEDMKEKRKKKRKTSKSSILSNPLCDTSVSPSKLGSTSCNLNNLVKPPTKEGESTLPQEGIAEMKAVSPSSPSSDIQILDVPVVVPEIITICDSDDDVSKLMKIEDNLKYCESICATGEEKDQVEKDPKVQTNSNKEMLEEMDDSEDNLKVLREAALKSSKPESRSDLNRDDEVLQLRLAALRSAIIRKCEERKRRGITLVKSKKNTNGQQIMSISPLGSPTHCSSGDNSMRTSDEVNGKESSSPFFSTIPLVNSSKDIDEDQITAVDMELVESDEEKEASNFHPNDAHEIEVGQNGQKVYFDPQRSDCAYLQQSSDDLMGGVILESSLRAHQSSREQLSVKCLESNVIAPSGYKIGDDLLSHPNDVPVPQSSQVISESQLESFQSKEESTKDIELDSKENKDKDFNMCSSDVLNADQMLNSDIENVNGQANKVSENSLQLPDGYEKSKAEHISDAAHQKVIPAQKMPSPLSPERQLDLQSMIVLDEIGKTSDEFSEDEDGAVEKYNDNTPENFSEEKVLLSEGGNMVHFRGMINSESLCENTEVHSDCVESNENGCESFKENGKMQLFDVMSNSRSPTSEKVSEISDAGDHLKVFEEIPGVALKILLTNSQSTADLNSAENTSDVPSEIVCCTEDQETICEAPKLFYTDSEELKAIEDCEFHSTYSDINMQIPHKSSSKENNVPSQLFSIEKNNSKPSATGLLLFSSGESSFCLSQDSRSMCEPNGKNGSTCSVVKLSEVPKEHALILDNAVNVQIQKKKIDGQITTTEDASLLRLHLLAMLKKRREEENKQEHTDNNECISDNKSSTALQTCSLSDNVFSEGSNVNKIECSDTLMKKPLFSPKKLQNSPLNLKPKVFQSRVSTVNKLGTKINKQRGTAMKVKGRFNVNVPKLVINLGEDSDSGEDIEGESLKTNSDSNIRVSNALKESRDHILGSQYVPPDFEKKLDLLLKQARIHQNTSDDVETESEKNVDILDNQSKIENKSEVKKIEKNINEDRVDRKGENESKCNVTEVKNSDQIKILEEKKSEIMRRNCVAGPQTKPLSVLNTQVSKKNRLALNSKSDVTSTIIHKVSPLVVRKGNNPQRKNTSFSLGNKNQMLGISNMHKTKILPGGTGNFHQRNGNGGVKNVSAHAKMNPSISSVVDIRLLPSSKQKEYLRLKRQLALLAQKEQEIKSKKNNTSMDATMTISRSTTTFKDTLVSQQDLSISNVDRSSVKKSPNFSSERTFVSRKILRKGEGIATLPKSDLGKSRRVVQTVPSTKSFQNTSTEQFTIITPNIAGNTCSERSSTVKHPNSVLLDRTTVTSSPKIVSPSIQISNYVTPSADEQKKSQCVALNICSDYCRSKSIEGKCKMQCSINKGPVSSERVPEIADSKGEQNSEIGALRITGNIMNPNETLLEVNYAVNTETTLSKKEEDFSESSVAKPLLETQVADCFSDKRVNANGREHTPFLKRKRSNSEDGRTQKRTCIALENHNNHLMVCENKTGLDDRKLAKELWCSESMLMSKRYQVLQDIAIVQVNLLQIEKIKDTKNQLVNDIQKLQEQLRNAEADLNKKEELLKTMFSEIESAKCDILRHRSETLLLSVKCEEIGYKVHGSNYSIPNSCTDLISNGMATISETLQNLKDGNNSTSGSEKGGMHTKDSNSSPVMANTESGNLEDITCDNPDKQIPGSYFSPLEAIRMTEPSNDIQAVLCPYHIMGSCKDKECAYQH